jgi:hypothetical protein
LQQSEERRTAEYRSTHNLKLRDDSRVRKEDRQTQQKHSPSEIERWQQSEERRIAKYSRSTHSLKLRNGSRVRKGGQPSTEALTSTDGSGA